MENYIIDARTNEIVPWDTCYSRGIVYVSKDYVEFGFFKESIDNVPVSISGETAVAINRDVIADAFWSNKLGMYMLPYKMTEEEISDNKYTYGQGEFPYRIPRRYEAIESFKLFEGAQKVHTLYDYYLTEELKYTFGLEFETSMGYIPQDKCFSDGLIPLRDGSITGIEYSTVVLSGNNGLNLLEQQLDTLSTYTKFNKDCALHIHFGGFPINKYAIYALYCIWYNVERELVNNDIVPALTFETSRYKTNKKDYCKMLFCTDSFEDLYTTLVGRRYLGNLYQPHPNDIERKAKWNIKTRYYGLNLINMLCYKGPKTVEFRFLRPSYNFNIIYTWIAILNAILRKAELFAQEWKESNCDTEDMFDWWQSNYKSLNAILKEIYPENIYKNVAKVIEYIRIGTKNQEANGDFCGNCYEILDEAVNESC